MPPVPAGFLGHVRSFVAVQTGCDHRCTFCSIWQARGESQSLPFEAIRDAVAREIDRGAKEIVLTGVDITD
jgi:threonylcarbamoyladenosine tRNA methylthiotransferase MtaB